MPALSEGEGRRDTKPKSEIVIRHKRPPDNPVSSQIFNPYSEVPVD